MTAAGETAGGSMSVTDTHASVVATVDFCKKCGRKRLLCSPHSEKGGPLFCLGCGMEWHAAYSRKRKIGRIVVKALKAFLDAGGSILVIERLRLRAQGLDFFGDGWEDTI